MDKPNYYAVLTAEVRYNKNLCANAKLLYAEITALTNLNSNCYATDSYFAELYDVDRRTIQLWLSELEKNKLIKRVIAYKKNSKEIESRFISLTLSNKSSVPLLNKNSLPYGKNIQYPTEKIFVENTSTTYSNTSPTDSNIILPPTPFNLNFITDESFKDLMQELVEHRKSIKKPFRTQKGVEIVYRDLLQFSNNNFEIARRIIDNTIAGGYQGIFALKQSAIKKTTKEEETTAQYNLRMIQERLKQEAMEANNA